LRQNLIEFGSPCFDEEVLIDSTRIEMVKNHSTRVTASAEIDYFVLSERGMTQNKLWAVQNENSQKKIVFI
jgi:hypothetical protein